MTTENKHAETTRAPSSTIPDEGVQFRLKARESKHVIYSRPEKDPLVGHYLGPDRDSGSDQIFTLLHGKDDRAGTYAIKSWYCGKLIFSRTTEKPHVGNVYGDPIDPDNWFTFPLDARDKNSFRIFSPASSSVIFSRANSAEEPHFGNYAGTKFDQDQLWHFERVED